MYRNLYYFCPWKYYDFAARLGQFIVSLIRSLREPPFRSTHATTHGQHRGSPKIDRSGFCEYSTQGEEPVRRGAEKAPLYSLLQNALSLHFTLAFKNPHAQLGHYSCLL